MVMTTPSYGERAQLCENPTAKKLLEIMDKKETNLAVAADVTTKAELLKIAKEVGPHICVLKTHIDIVEDFDLELIHQLQELAHKQSFLLFEDRKFADIGNTVKQQYANGVYHIADWADIVNAHSLPGPGIVKGLGEVGIPKGRGLLLLAEMSSEGALTTTEYAAKTVAMAKENPEFVIGFISQRKLVEDPRFIHMTPGVNLSSKDDPLGQQYNTPENVIRERHSDIIIVGRGICKAENPGKEAIRYREAGWQARSER